MQEQWRPVVGYEDTYEVSNLGRVRSLPKYACCGYEGRGLRSIPGRILRPGRKGSGHVTVALGKGNSKQVHALVAQAFLGPIPEGKEVCHVNGNPADNRAENLYYGTRTENILDVYRQGKRWRKLSLGEVSEIRAALARGVKGSTLASEYGVSQNCISCIKNGRTFYWTQDTKKS